MLYVATKRRLDSAGIRQDSLSSLVEPAAAKVKDRAAISTDQSRA